MDAPTLTRQQARRFLLVHQGLWPPCSLTGKAGVLSYIRRVGCIQYDPLNIVGRNAELALQARIANFRPEMLDELLYEDRALLDGWDKNMSIYAVEDWPYFARRREGARRHYGDPTRPAAAILPQVRQEIEERGPLSSIDLAFDQTVNWSWAPTRIARAALESMYRWGELIVHHKVNTRKVYDFARRHIAEELLSAPDPNETEEAYHDWAVQRRIGAVGLLWNRAGDAWLGMQGRPGSAFKSVQRKAALERLVARGEVFQVAVAGIDWPCYMRDADRPALEKALAVRQPSPQATVLAPLDNLMWDRRYVEALFDFEYLWEVYKPVAERRWGYYVLPILFGDRFLARFEPGRDKTSESLTIQNWWWEAGVEPTDEVCAALCDCFERFLSFLGRETLQIDREMIEAQGLDFLRCHAGARRLRNGRV
jgi:uncharacterized protein YcaQ